MIKNIYTIKIDRYKFQTWLLKLNKFLIEKNFYLTFSVLKIYIKLKKEN